MAFVTNKIVRLEGLVLDPIKTQAEQLQPRPEHDRHHHALGTVPELYAMRDDVFVRIATVSFPGTIRRYVLKLSTASTVTRANGALREPASCRARMSARSP